MKKAIKTIIIIGIVIISTLAAVEANEAKNEEKFYRSQIQAVVEYTGLRYIGEIDSYEISKKTGCLYDGKAVESELLKLAGYPEDMVTRKHYVGTYGNFELLKLYILKPEKENQLLYEMPIVEELLYTNVV